MDLNDPQLYINRELSWLEFNERVLQEAQDATNPLMERLKFLAITSSNLDEFFMVRVSSLMSSDESMIDPAGLTPKMQLKAIAARVHEMVLRQYHCFNRALIPAMKDAGIRFLKYAKLNDMQKNQVDAYFDDVLYQILTPMAIDQSRPFPNINNKTINIFIELVADVDAQFIHAVEWDEKSGRWRITDKKPVGPKYALVQMPTVVPRIVNLVSDGETTDYILLDDILLAHVARLFPGYIVTMSSLIRITRDSDIDIEEEEIEDLMDVMSKSIKGRQWGEPVRIEISKTTSTECLQVLKKALRLTDDMIYKINGPLDLTSWMGFASGELFAAYRHKPHPNLPIPAFLGQNSMFDAIRKQDVLVHHPYQSFDCVVDFVTEAATDPAVLAIKQTLYRVSGNSPIINALIQAAENGKQVSVLVELKARFDEENNITWAKLLEKSGVHVIYGLVGLKTHCKVCLVVRREDDGIRRYMHLGTGNYNETTARFYTDFCLFTCREPFGQDASILFNVLTGFSKAMDWQKFAVAPVTLRNTFLRLIEIEQNNALEGKPSGICARMNSLSDVEIIQALYRASQAGVKIRLLVRGICCLRPGVAGVSENIQVSSIVDRYLEHSRIYTFTNGGRPRAYLSSADLMQRNLDRRVEILFPIEDDNLSDEIIDVLNISLKDNVKRRIANSDGTYTKQNRRGTAQVHSQLMHHKRAADAYKRAVTKQQVFLAENPI